jgi:division protein CdvB (Snf7/Vps24/ESCRT-III family)
MGNLGSMGSRRSQRSSTDAKKQLGRNIYRLEGDIIAYDIQIRRMKAEAKRYILLQDVKSARQVATAITAIKGNQSRIRDVIFQLNKMELQMGTATSQDSLAECTKKAAKIMRKINKNWTTENYNESFQNYAQEIDTNETQAEMGNDMLAAAGGEEVDDTAQSDEILRQLMDECNMETLAVAPYAPTREIVAEAVAHEAALEQGSEQHQQQPENESDQKQ